MTTLNSEQQRAVNTTEGPVLIIAGAGAGKTGVITHRILNLIKKGVPPHSILAITFTNKAAKEMRERVNALIAQENSINRPISMNERPFMSTFHSLGVHIIRENASILGLTRHFTIFDRSDSRRAIKEAMTQCSIDPKKIDPGTVLNMISRAKGDGHTRLEYLDAAKDFMQETVANVWEKYDAILAKEKSLDFDDLLSNTAHLLEKYPAIRQHYQNVWKYVHIDEYQDTNKVQYRIAKYLADAHMTDPATGEVVSINNICVVGDADQNIYSWRGATIENILNFEKDYPMAAVITLEKNYRSTKTILAAANNVIEKNTMRKKKTLYTDNDHGEKITLIVSYTENEEARAIADIARGLIAKGASPKEIAVLYRANFQSRAIEDAFIKKNIPYQLVGVRFFERKEVKDVLSYVKAALNRESAGDIARIINVPVRGIGKVTVAKVISGKESELPAGTRIKVSQFWKLLDDIKKEIEEKKPSEAIKFIIQETGMEQALRQGDAEDEERLLNIRELVSVAAQYDNYEVAPAADQTPETESVISPGIEAFLSNAALASDQDELAEDRDAVRLMTVHASKGLEFDHVLIAGLEQDLFPFKRMDEADIDKAGEEEERRLFYVAITRARKKVYFSYTMLRTIYGTQRVSLPSEFIDDIKKDLIEDQAPPEKPSGAKALFIDF
ncbi:MAG TPA: UvrD-helicase domain-containing protein [Candidatus Paceibacterota bacterium]|jgi:DNA helicase-2/ATP-dependent DNA helicase PcrA|nr:UvrD-helicase domain-containing protein [Candidatus Paceibacterota bacterium]